MGETSKVVDPQTSGFMADSLPFTLESTLKYFMKTPQMKSCYISANL